ncbi:hypothetical protein CEUSTIGMA_g13244.t1 [Chlamydomonas eustigma]|uniref:Tc1-like transposase DDE domain-containing protein n=1 Tax=Chlamydomonas eustigma TaxID=1157962 RepID=A0A250XSA9_9CHLO|nr:hypothetical protein CEUSTIGMA_g13244.t1 [Chlamydomonas eustigma]|eukprot:GAX85829.1 hypothetical protein CEUSTIGMA_g13244.t1 [Chlamydomonas eustigma]
MTYTSQEERWAIIAHWKQNGNSHITARELKLTVKVVDRWIRRYETTGDVSDAQKSGRLRKLNASAAKKALKLLLEREHGNSAAVAQMLYAYGCVNQQFSRRTVTRSAHKAAKAEGMKIKHVQGRPRKKLTAATMQKRVAFCTAMMRMNWMNALFTDRKKFHFSYPGCKVTAGAWVLEGQSLEVPTVNHAQCQNVYAGITAFGMTKLHIVAGSSGHQNKQGRAAKNITSMEYGQQDNDPTHKAAKPEVEQWNAKHASSMKLLMGWPPSNSPDLNPIENFWSYLQAKVNKRGCKTFSEFKVALEAEAESVPTTYFLSLVKSMPDRIRACLTLNGEKTKY